jgi:DNA-binding CsgD family transcriptional regulator
MLTGAESLTASERRIAELAATGASNPHIAQQLYVSRKTVETHLGHAYQKLGCRRVSSWLWRSWLTSGSNWPEGGTASLKPRGASLMRTRSRRARIERD